jgi:hypothetical protein
MAFEVPVFLKGNRAFFVQHATKVSMSRAGHGLGPKLSLLPPLFPMDIFIKSIY